MTNNKATLNQRAQFAKLYATGKYNQGEIAEMVGISRQSVNKWARTSEPTNLIATKHHLTKELKTLSEGNSYAANAAKISNLISDIERVDKLIKTALK